MSGQKPTCELTGLEDLRRSQFTRFIMATHHYNLINNAYFLVFGLSLTFILIIISAIKKVISHASAAKDSYSLKYRRLKYCGLLTLVFSFIRSLKVKVKCATALNLIVFLKQMTIAVQMTNSGL